MRTLMMLSLLLAVSACSGSDADWNQTISQWCGDVMSCGGGGNS